MKNYMAVLAFSFFTISQAHATCKLDKIRNNFFHGTVIILSQHIPWQIDRKDRGSTTLWLKGDRVLVCSTGTIKHLHYGDCVGAKRIR